MYPGQWVYDHLIWPDCVKAWLYWLQNGMENYIAWLPAVYHILLREVQERCIATDWIYLWEWWPCWFYCLFKTLVAMLGSGCDNLKHRQKDFNTQPVSVNAPQLWMPPENGSKKTTSELPFGIRMTVVEVSMVTTHEKATRTTLYQIVKMTTSDSGLWLIHSNWGNIFWKEI